MGLGVWVLLELPLPEEERQRGAAVGHVLMPHQAVH